MQAIKEIEKMNKLIELSTEKRGRVTLRKHISILIPHIDKIFMDYLNPTSQFALEKFVDKAENILRTF